MNLHDVNRGVTKNKRRKRIGRGTGSGLGKTSGRGHKGQGARAGFSMRPTFEGGQMPISRRIPKRGFHNRFARAVCSINVGELDELFDDGDEVSPASLKAKGRLKGRYDELKILGDGELTKKLAISAHRFSRTAKEKIEKAGATANVLPGPAPVVKNKQRSAQKTA